MFLLRKASLAALGLACLCPLAAQAHDFPRIRNFIESYQTPWYMYFPNASAMPGPSQSYGFPTWPSNFPPPQSQPAWQLTMPAPGFGPGTGYPSSALGQPTGQTTGYGQAPGFLPVGNSNMSMPSYWFAR